MKVCKVEERGAESEGGERENSEMDIHGRSIVVRVCKADGRGTRRERREDSEEDI